MRHLFGSLVVGLCCVVFVSGQTPAFEAASIKPSAPDPSGNTPTVSIGPQPGGRWMATNSTMGGLLVYLYPQYYFRGHDFGGPDWSKRMRFDINAVAQGNPSRDALNEMARALLKERFALAYHIEERQVDVWAVVMASRNGTRGPGLTPAAYDCTAFYAARDNGQTPPAIPPPSPGGKPSCGWRATQEGGITGTMHVQAGGLTLAQIASNMENFNMPERRPFVDRTGLEGRYDVDFRFTIYNDPTTDTMATGVPLQREAMEDTLGLRLEGRKETRQGLVIDRVTEPSPD